MLGWCRKQLLFPSELWAIPWLQQALPALHRHSGELIWGRFSFKSNSGLMISLRTTRVEREGERMGKDRQAPHTQPGDVLGPQQTAGTVTTLPPDHSSRAAASLGRDSSSQDVSSCKALSTTHLSGLPGAQKRPSRGGQQAESSSSPGAGRMLHGTSWAADAGWELWGVLGRTSSFSGSLDITMVCGAAVASFPVPLERPKREEI